MMPRLSQRIMRREGDMVSIGTKCCAALALFAEFVAPAVARTPAKPVRASEPAPSVLLAEAGFALSDGTVSPAAAVQASSRALARDRAGEGAERGARQFRNVTVGPSWSYQSARTGALIEMGALGGGVVADRPKLAHVAFAWQF